MQDACMYVTCTDLAWGSRTPICAPTWWPS